MKHDASPLKRKLLTAIYDELETHPCMGCALQALANAVATMANVVIENGTAHDVRLADTTATALEIIADHCRRMTPIATDGTPARGRPN